MIDMGESGVFERLRQQPVLAVRQCCVRLACDSASTCACSKTLSEMWSGRNRQVVKLSLRPHSSRAPRYRVVKNDDDQQHDVVIGFGTLDMHTVLPGPPPASATALRGRVAISVHNHATGVRLGA